MEPYKITRIGLDDYPKCGTIWDMDACPYTQTFISQIRMNKHGKAIKNRLEKEPKECRKG